jgi:hypothetical protein
MDEQEYIGSLTSEEYYGLLETNEIEQHETQK